jgi:hypothetical protein
MTPVVPSDRPLALGRQSTTGRSPLPFTAVRYAVAAVIQLVITVGESTPAVENDA